MRDFQDLVKDIFLIFWRVVAHFFNMIISSHWAVLIIKKIVKILLCLVTDKLSI